MKTRELYSIVLKIIGLLSLWQFITMISTIILSGFGMFSMLFSNGGQVLFGFLIASVFAILLQTVLPLIISIYCLFRTDTLLRVLKLDEDSTLELLSERKVLYHLAILSFGVFLFANGAHGFMSVDIKTETTTGMLNAMNNINNSSNGVNIMESKNYHVNIIALIESLIGLIVLIKSKTITDWALSRIDSNVGSR